MLRLLEFGSPALERFLESLVRDRADNATAVDATVTKIVEQVRRGGDDALQKLSWRLDRIKLQPNRIRVTPPEIRSALETLSSGERRALELAARRIADFHRRTLERPFSYRDALGMRLGQLVRPLRRVGIYVPGGTGAYPSSVLMNAIPARVAGVHEIVMVSPVTETGDRPGVLAAAAIAGISEVYRVGGAHAIAALAYGTESIAPVDKIVGPGNAYVQAAKRMVYGTVDIDKMAGPSEVLVIADEHAKPEWLAADLIAQAEHGSGDECAILLTPSRPLANRVSAAVEEALSDLPRAASVRVALQKRGAAVVVPGLNQAFQLANRIAPEHLQLDISGANQWLPEISAAGAVFVGPMSPSPLGDYIAGPNHVLPTGGSARFASPLGAYDFLKRTSIIVGSRAAVQKLGPEVARLARMEGFEGHARAIELRLRPRAATNTKGNTAPDLASKPIANKNGRPQKSRRHYVN
ncbi:MAG: histidinol dehydrogenase [Deltaproteobacteria bacterium]|nr:histidinol dehydrogenase [Deltaproteobacteria bacterium]